MNKIVQILEWTEKTIFAGQQKILYQYLQEISRSFVMSGAVSWVRDWSIRFYMTALHLVTDTFSI